MNTEKTIDPYLGLVTIAQVAMFRQSRVMNGFHFPDNQNIDFWVKDGILTFQYIDRIDQLTQGEGEPIEEAKHEYLTINLLENERIEQLYDRLEEVFEVIENHEIFINPIK
jgi:hypothetical protein